MRPTKISFFLLVFLIAFSFTLLGLLKSPPVIIFTYVSIVASLLYILMAAHLFKVELTITELVALIGIGIILRIVFINFSPVGSDDIYRYIWDGKIQSYGINPYKYAPNDPGLNFLHSAVVPGRVNFPWMKTIYFPLSQWLFYVGFMLSGEKVWGYKLLLFISELLTAGALFLLLKKLKINRKFMLLYLLCPVPILHFAIDAHLDGFGLPFLLFSLLFYLNGKRLTALILLGLSLTIKPVGLILIPIIFLIETGWKRKVESVLVPIAAFMIQFIPYLKTSNPFETFLIYSKNWTFNGVVFNLLDSVFHYNQKTRLICAILLIFSLLPLYFGRMELIRKFYYAVLLLMLFSPVVHPWYIAWVAILLPLIPRWSGILFTALSGFSVLTVLNYQLFGIWKEYPFVLIIEYLPFVLFMLYELKMDRPISYSEMAG